MPDSAIVMRVGDTDTHNYRPTLYAARMGETCLTERIWNENPHKRFISLWRRRDQHTSEHPVKVRVSGWIGDQGYAGIGKSRESKLQDVLHGCMTVQVMKSSIMAHEPLLLHQEFSFDQLIWCSFCYSAKKLKNLATFFIFWFIRELNILTKNEISSTILN